MVATQFATSERPINYSSALGFARASVFFTSSPFITASSVIFPERVRGMSAVSNTRAGTCRGEQ